MTWQGMVQRCTNPKSRHWKYYGGRGITVAPEWQDFAVFLRDMGEKPPGLTLDRIDNSLGYCSENCRWATWVEQARNRRPARERPESLKGQARQAGLPYLVVWNRINRFGWSRERALSIPVYPYRARPGPALVILSDAALEEP
jgi:hypothetical protein